jgi:toxin ParE1/3/4
VRSQLTAEAKADLDKLNAHLVPINPKALHRVVTAIEQRILLTVEYPAGGRLSPRDDVREAIEPRYGFLIPYMVKGDTLHILRIYGGMRQPLDYQLLPSPEE